MTDQEIFDKVATHLLTQNARSIDGDKCCYRGPNGLQCAVGCLIPDDLYYRSIEGFGVPALSGVAENKNPLTPILEQVGVERNQRGLLRALQKTHDDPRIPVEKWRQHLAIIAREFRLSASIVDNFPHG